MSKDELFPYMYENDIITSIEREIWIEKYVHGANKTLCILSVLK